MAGDKNQRANVLQGTLDMLILQTLLYGPAEKGRKQLAVEESQWKQMAQAVARVMWPASEES